MPDRFAAQEMRFESIFRPTTRRHHYRQRQRPKTPPARPVHIPTIAYPLPASRSGVFYQFCPAPPVPARTPAVPTGMPNPTAHTSGTGRDPQPHCHTRQATDLRRRVIRQSVIGRWVRLPMAAFSLNGTLRRRPQVRRNVIAYPITKAQPDRFAPNGGGGAPDGCLHRLKYPVPASRRYPPGIRRR